MKFQIFVRVCSVGPAFVNSKYPLRASILIETLKNATSYQEANSFYSIATNSFYFRQMIRSLNIIVSG